MWILQVFCGAYYSWSLPAALVEPDNKYIISEELVDLTETEIDKFKGNVTTPEDVLEICNFLNNIKGDLSQYSEES